MHMKKTAFKAIAALLFLYSLALTSCETKNELNASQKSLSNTERKAALDVRKKWEASPDGKKYKAWLVSAEGKKVNASYEKIKKSIKAFSDMEAVVLSLNFQRANGNSPGTKWIIVKISGYDYMMQFTPKEFQQLNGLKVNDTIIVKSRNAGLSPNHPFLILSGDYMEKNGKILFERHFSKQKPC